MIQKLNIQEYVDSLFNIPQLNELNTKEQLKSVFNWYLDDLYLELPSPQLKYLNFELTQRIIKVIFRNYGISPSLYKNLSSTVQKNLVFRLEYLFQNKGNLKVIEIFKEILKIFYNKINFYSVSVNKLNSTKYNSDTGEVEPAYKIAYTLKPLCVTPGDKINFFPDSKVNRTGKFLMELSNFMKETFFPIDTNLLYIDFADPFSIGNNKEVFYNGIRAYFNTKYQNTSMSFYLENINKTISISTQDIELLLTYLNIEFIRNHSDNKQKNYTFQERPIVYNSLRMNIEELDNIHDILYEYKHLNVKDRKAFTGINRKWQFLLYKYKANSHDFDNYQKIKTYIEDNYPDFIKSFNQYKTDDISIIQFSILLYLQATSIITFDDDYSSKYLTTIFQNFIIGPVFIEKIFQPLYKIFINYFLPCQMSYINKLNNDLKLKDKFNIIPTETIFKTNLFVRNYSLDVYRRIEDINIRTNIKEDSKVYFPDLIQLLVKKRENDVNEIKDKEVNTRIKGSFLNPSDLNIDNFIWNKKRNTGLSKFDYTSMIEDETIIKNNLDTYLFYHKIFNIKN